MREVREEVNLDIVLEKLSRWWWFTKWDMHLIGMTYVARCENADLIQLSDEHSDYFWKSKDEILKWDFPEWLKEEIKVV